MPLGSIPKYIGVQAAEIKYYKNVNHLTDKRCYLLFFYGYRLRVKNILHTSSNKLS